MKNTHTTNSSKETQYSRNFFRIFENLKLNLIVELLIFFKRNILRYLKQLIEFQQTYVHGRVLHQKWEYFLVVNLHSPNFSPKYLQEIQIDLSNFRPYKIPCSNVKLDNIRLKRFYILKKIKSRAGVKLLKLSNILIQYGVSLLTQVQSLIFDYGF